MIGRGGRDREEDTFKRAVTTGLSDLLGTEREESIKNAPEGTDLKNKRTSGLGINTESFLTVV